ncbi:MAG: hypothetical protein M1457_03355, partial [bacterium]|nr:hypothetical protein [bacterium]
MNTQHKHNRTYQWHIKCASILMILIIYIVLPTAMANIIHVPSDVPSISGAARLAFDGDEIIVSPGIYKGQIGDHSRSLNIHSIDPTNWDIVNSTIIEGDGPQTKVVGVGFAVSDAVTSRLAGFTIRNWGGGGIKGGGPTCVIEYCHIYDNWGGAYFKTPYYSSFGKLASPAPTGGDDRLYGGGIFDCHGTIRNCIIERNYAEIGGGLAFCSGVIENNLIARNRLVDYGNRGAMGAAMYGCGAIIRGNTIVDNGVGGMGPNDTYVWRGGGLVSSGGPIVNNIIWINHPTMTPEYISCDPPTYSCLKGWTGGGEGNIAADPKFVNATFDEVPGMDHAWPAQDWRLQGDSPCI